MTLFIQPYRDSTDQDVDDAYAHAKALNLQVLPTGNFGALNWKNVINPSNTKNNDN